ncbi:hypothetical protein N7519_010197 [Penicillium mononematosum]|uniref:uncharacterized protein n=1 Tax=Penicillium mononematosum TaxID=268346 RepID=UPI00254667C1|nr:uncharacterized protein N7519_010197 [Penicillium mononematosum]KAJ6179736.1 hypothetical protein N7519_010197 [Penicillium mononematosum]
MSRNISYGRGGAGNITRQQSAPTPKDLVTPTIKQEVFTTGRGGSGNMMHNDPERPQIARESQDVESPPLRAQQIPHHTGRGGAANAYIPTPEEEEREKKIHEQEAELIRVRTQSKDRVKEIEQERQELRKETPSSS